MSNTSLLGSYGGQAGDALMFRNRIINGECLVAQRGAVVVLNNQATYGGADRFFVAPLGFTTVTGGSITKSAFAETISGFGQWLSSFSCTGSGTVVMGQRIESLNTLDLNSKTVTFSGLLYHNVGSTVTVSIKINKANAVDNFTGVTQIGSAGSINVPSGVATPFSLTVTLGSTDGNNGMSTEVTFTGLSNLSSKSFGIGNFQLEAGPTATPFERRPIGTELALCQRYAHVIRSDGNAVYARYGIGECESTTTCSAIVSLPQQMRSTPVIAGISAANTFAVYSAGVSTPCNGTPAIAVSGSTNNILQLNFGVASGLTLGRAGQCISNNTANSFIVLSAEL